MYAVAKPKLRHALRCTVIGVGLVPRGRDKIGVIVIEAGRTCNSSEMRLPILPIAQRFRSLFASCNRQSKIYNLRFFRGVLAQLVERLNGIEEVRGSNPLGSSLRWQALAESEDCRGVALAKADRFHLAKISPRGLALKKFQAKVQQRRLCDV